MATVGDVLPSAEAGWKRIPFTNENIHYHGNWTAKTSSVGIAYKAGGINESVTMYFTGSRIRFIGFKKTNSDKNSVVVDGIAYEVNIQPGSSTVGNVVLFEKTDLTSEEEHWITISVPNDSTYKTILLIAFDIDENGEILPFKSSFTETIDGQQITYRKAVTTKQIANPGSAAKILITIKHIGTIIALCCSIDDGATWHLAKADDYTAIAPGSSVKLKILMDADAELMAYGVGWF